MMLKNYFLLSSKKNYKKLDIPKFMCFFVPEMFVINNSELTTLFIFIYFFMNIYIGNLSYGVKESDLTKVMEDYGTVGSVKIIKDRETGRSKGFAFCEMENDDEAKKAIEQLNGAEYSGRPMVVKEALPRN